MTKGDCYFTLADASCIAVTLSNGEERLVVGCCIKRKVVGIIPYHTVQA